MLLLDVPIVLKNSIVTWQGSHLSFKKGTIWTKISTPPFDIQRSKGIVQILHDIRDGDTNLSLGIQQSLAKYHV